MSNPLQQSTTSLPEPIARLVASAGHIRMATADGSNEVAFLPLQEFLAQVRMVFRMDVAFVSEFSPDQRVFRLISAAAASLQINVGDADPLLDTYCKLIVESRLDRCIPDTATSPAADLAVTRKLRIGAYLAATIRLPDGKVFGTLCCYSHSSRPDLRDTDAEILQVLADAVAASIDRHGELQETVWRGGPAPGAQA
jgi:GAF domain-containing protein